MHGGWKRLAQTVAVLASLGVAFAIVWWLFGRDRTVGGGGGGAVAALLGLLVSYAITARESQRQNLAKT